MNLNRLKNHYLDPNNLLEQVPFDFTDSDGGDKTIWETQVKWDCIKIISGVIDMTAPEMNYMRNRIMNTARLIYLLVKFKKDVKFPKEPVYEIHFDRYVISTIDDKEFDVRYYSKTGELINEVKEFLSFEELYKKLHEFLLEETMEKALIAGGIIKPRHPEDIVHLI